MHSIILEQKSTNIKHKSMHVQTIDFEIKVILSANLYSSTVYRNYSNLLLDKSSSVKLLATYKPNFGVITCFELKKLIKKLLSKRFHSSLYKCRNKLFIRKMFICERKSDIAIFSNDIVNNIQMYILKELCQKK